MNTPREPNELNELLSMFDDEPAEKDTRAKTTALLAMFEDEEIAEEKLLIYKPHHSGRSIYSSWEQIRAERDQK